MKCDVVQMLLPDFEDGRLSPQQTTEVRRHVESCESCAAELAVQRRLNLAFKTDDAPAPSRRLQASFYAWLEAEKRAASPSRDRGFEHHPWWFQRFFLPLSGAVAACALFAGGLIVGVRTFGDRPIDGRDLQTARELAELRQQVASMRQAVAWTMLQQNSTSERLKTVLDLKSATDDPGVANELLGVLAYDDSSTVRLRAVEVLSRHTDDVTVRLAVAQALAREPSPTVQLAMIDLLAATGAPEAASALDEFSRSEEPNEIVRNAAVIALARM